MLLTLSVRLLSTRLRGKHDPFIPLHYQPGS